MYLDNILEALEKYNLYNFKGFTEVALSLTNEDLEELYTNILYIHFHHNYFNPSFLMDRMKMLKLELERRNIFFDDAFYGRIRMYVMFRQNEA